MMTTAELNRTERANSVSFPTVKEQNHLRILSANVNSVRYGYNSPDITAVFNRYTPDIVAIQDAAFLQLGYFERKMTPQYKVTGYQLDKQAVVSYEDNKNCRITPSEKSPFVAILYNSDTIECLESGYYPIENSELVTWAVMKEKKCDLHFVVQSAHFAQKSNRLKNIEIVIQETKKLQQRVQTCSFFVFAGDLNTFPRCKDRSNKGEIEYNAITKFFVDVRDQALHHFGPDGTNPGHHGRYRFEGDPYQAKKHDRFSIDRLDHLFLTADDMEVVNEGVITDCVGDNQIFELHRYPKPSASDHYFVAVDLQKKLEAAMAALEIT